MNSHRWYFIILVYLMMFAFLSACTENAGKEESPMTVHEENVHKDGLSDETASLSEEEKAVDEGTMKVEEVYLSAIEYPKVTSRDPWKWPFSSDSIWNTPIGSDAVYKPANFKAESSYIGMDVEYHIILKEDDPIRDIYSPTSWEKRWPGVSKLGSMPVPDDLIIPDADPPHTPNNCAAFLMPDGRTIKQLEPATRVEPGKHIVGWPCKADQDIYGPGIYGTHFGSGLSSIGGSIRLGELTSDEPIRHVLKINVWAKKYCYYSDELRGYRWPADRADSYAKGNYGGTDPSLVMGTLLAIPPFVTIESLDLQTEPAKKLFYALQDFGAYIVDDSAWDAFDFSAEIGVQEEFKEKYGYDFTGRSGLFQQDVKKLIEALHIVDNNSPESIGGGGEIRRAPRAPELQEP